MKRYWVLILFFIACAGAAGYWYGLRRAGNEKSAEDPPTTQSADEPIAHVATVAAKIDTISQTLTAYGVVIAQPGQVRILTLPFESSIVKTLVASGQRVQAETDVLEVQASPDTFLNFQQTKNEVEAATRDLEQTQQRFNDRLATNQELSQAKQTLQAATLKLNSFQQRGVGAAQNLEAQITGVVSKLDVQDGQIVPAGNALIEIAAENHIEIKVGVEPEMVDRLKPDQPVQILPIGTSSPLQGRVRMVAHVVNPDTRLVDVFVSIPPEISLMIDRNVRCDLTIASKDTLVVPRQATLVEGDGYSIFTIANGHAVKHKIELGLSNEQEVELVNSDVKAGDKIVIVGNAELEDKMAVEEKQP